MNKLTILTFCILSSLHIEGMTLPTMHINFPTELLHCITETHAGSARRPAVSYAAFTAKSLANQIDSLHSLARLDLFQSEKMSCAKIRKIKIDSISHFAHLPAELTLKLSPIENSGDGQCNQLIEGRIVIHQSRANDVIQLPSIQLLAQEIDYFDCKQNTKENI